MQTICLISLLLVAVALTQSDFEAILEVKKGFAKNPSGKVFDPWDRMALSLKRYTCSHYRSDGILKERSQREREMSIVMGTMTSDPLPEDVVIEILSRLSVKNLLQFKCVCKSWYAIITSPNFISKHLKNYYNNIESDCLLAQYCVTQAGELHSYEVLVDETPRVLSYESLNNMPIHSPYVYGPCDGIFYMYGHFYEFRALWNPAVNELKTLPPIPNPPSGFSYSPQYDAYGFGLHPVSKDYEVVVLKDYWPEKQEDRGGRYPLCVFVYSLSTDSWRYLGDLCRYYDLRNNKCYICVNGGFYWLGSYELCGNPEVIVSFDMASDMWQEIQLPDYDKSYNCESLAVYHDSIALLVVQDKFLDLWTLNERCWTKQFAIGPLSEVCYPVGHCQNSKLILASSYPYELMLCDPSIQEIRNLGFKGGHRCEGIFVYKESLVLVNNGNGCRQHDQEAETESNCQISRSSLYQNSSDEEYYDGISNLFD